MVALRQNFTYVLGRTNHTDIISGCKNKGGEYEKYVNKTLRI